MSIDRGIASLAHVMSLRSRANSLSRARGLRQVGLYVGAYAVYSAARWLAHGDEQAAIAHARSLFDLERSLDLGVEPAVQHALAGTPVIWGLNALCLIAQLVGVPGTLLWLYRRSPAVYVRLRDTVLATWLLAIPVYAAFPVAPPRMAGIGLADTIGTHAGLGLKTPLSTAFYNPLAAVPSLHAGFALAVGVALACAAGRPIMRAFALAWPALVAAAVVATGNHFVFDVAAGAATVAAGYGVARGREALWRRPRARAFARAESRPGSAAALRAPGRRPPIPALVAGLDG
jgi:PAP2 superfamily